MFSRSLGAVAAAGGVARLNVQDDFPSARKYEPLDYLRVSNMGNIRVDLYLNGHFHTPVPPGTILVIDDEAVRTVDIVNPHGSDATVSGDIVLQLQRAPLNVDKVARRGV